ncbi:hypothetical protein [Cohaesibacter sp. ES.047]|uniref:hypothetical protein n=1 Tax=Cohaesibacter sp. ES.047 TaxID=1798205 RepID=UPI001FCF0366|nr:hypothetical protein [Cohaesibacter sp. ES.047]
MVHAGGRFDRSGVLVKPFQLIVELDTVCSALLIAREQISELFIASFVRDLQNFRGVILASQLGDAVDCFFGEIAHDVACSIRG